MIVLIVLAYSLSFCSASRCGQRESANPRIVNGFIVEPKKFPFVVAIYINHGSYVCVGTLITPKFLVTAGHCFDEGLTYNIVAGTTDLRKVEDKYRRMIKTVTKHPEYEYSYTGIKYDVAVAELDEELSLVPEKIMYASLPPFSSVIPEEFGTVLGWGDTHDENIPSETVLLGVNLIIDIDCDASDEFFCLGHPDGDKDSCYGDSGGPFIINGTLYGVVSHSTSADCGTGIPGRYTKIPYVVMWIREIAGLPRRLSTSCCQHKAHRKCC
ncbi:brachyurin-like isoform X1 [Coccinella septempunctata]|uniref:brachyurin-like isoform X1 n=1 Tax=Coccinella septempunctata TaxID=41139 RepID=UPI001D095C94|nr:brachyurin-like isoform X1 [Coccinella septempunctata]